MTNEESTPTTSPHDGADDGLSDESLDAVAGRVVGDRTGRGCIPIWPGDDLISPLPIEPIIDIAIVD